MGELDELPSWAGRSAGEVPAAALPAAADVDAEAGAAGAPTDPPDSAHPVDADEPRRRSRLSRILLPLLGVALLLGAGAVGYVLASRDSDTTEATAADTETDGAETDAQDSSEATGSEPTATDAETDGTDGADDAGDAGDAETETVTVGGDDETDDDDAEAGADGTTDADGDGTAESMSERQAIFRGGKVYLSGAVPSEEVAAIIVERASAVLGPDNVVNEYVIDPSVEIAAGESTPLVVEDVILFEFNSVAIAEPFFPILDLGTLLLSQNPQASVTVITRTDAVGSEAVNLEVAARRAQSIVDYWLARGVDPDQILTDPRGEEGASDDDDAAAAARQRRAEFVITGLLD